MAEENEEVNTGETTSGLFQNKMLLNTIIITTVLFFILTYIHYKITYIGEKSEILIDGNKDGKEKLEISNERIQNSESNSFTYSLWFYIESYDYKKTQTKSLFYKGDRGTKQYFPLVNFQPYTNNIKIALSQTENVTRGVTRTKTPSIQIKGVPIKKWNHLVITMNGNTLNTYLNGYLEADLVLTGNPAVNDMPLIINDNAGFKGIVKKMIYYDFHLSSEKCYQLYSAGPDTDLKIITYIDYLLSMLKLKELFGFLGRILNLEKLFNINKICKAAGANVTLTEKDKE